MHPVFLIAIKDLKQLLRDRIGLFFLVGFPVLIGVFFGFVFGGGASSESIHLRVAVVDEDRSAQSTNYLAKLASTIDVVKTNREPAFLAVKQGKLDGVVVILKGFGEKAGMFWGEEPATVQVGMDPARKAMMGMLRGLLLEGAGQLVSERMAGFMTATNSPITGQFKSLVDEIKQDEQIPPGLKNSLTNLFGAMIQLRETRLEEQARVPEKLEMPYMELMRVDTIKIVRQKQNGDLGKLQSSWDITFPQAIMWGVLACAAGFAVTIVREQVRGTLLRLQVSAISNWQMLAGKSLACFISVVCVVTFLIGVGMAFGMRPKDPLLLCLAVFCVACCFVGVTMLMAVWGRTEEAVSGAAWAVGMVFSMIGGATVPLAFLPKFMGVISHISPFKWAILSLEGAIWREFSLSEMLFPCGVLLAIGAVTFALGQAILRRRLT